MKNEKVTYPSEEEIKKEVQRYRAAIKARTLCERCLTANPPKSNYCSACGKPVG